MVIVTTAVYRGLYGLKPDFTYLHWAGLIDCTHPYEFAIYYVFRKQSEMDGI